MGEESAKDCVTAACRKSGEHVDYCPSFRHVCKCKYCKRDAEKASPVVTDEQVKAASRAYAERVFGLPLRELARQDAAELLGDMRAALEAAAAVKGKR